jgi:hypothetical protein
MKIQTYSANIEAQMRNFYHSLSEKDRRRYAAIEAKKLGYGRARYICRILYCDDRTITRGQQELKTDLSNEEKRLRKSGGGHKLLLPTLDGIDKAFLEILSNHTAGSPMDETIKWTNLSRPAIAEKLDEQGFSVSVTLVDQRLKKHNFRPRQAFKAEAGKTTIPYRDEQFQNIQRLKKEYSAQGNPVFSMDVKKKN